LLTKMIRAGCSAILFAVLSPLQAQTFTLRVLHSFNGKQGENPFGSGLVRDSAGNLYGTTKIGGAANAGVVFKLSKTGKETVLYTFKGGADGSNPNGGVILDSAGNLYGTAYQGGAANQGVVFEVDAAGTYKVLYNFCSLTNCTDGVHPLTGSLVLDSAGNLYGTAGGGAYITKARCSS
jgi:uncharacterized repeat protein (TIGR03803 family)